ncbi:tRNA (adenosine(37)-N6)-threonylcarbamoyltransferase complex dimerization subunit type 1 TsaB [Candidatus Desantisbacteria bacterium]|nr:tRNA (adenosine(37)-N6)-threonylcarbamoyltransferase complex dimerization subunit type 1 TsaB [Candidatus Desantisbacteria bacterium]
MWILGIETSTRTGSLALLNNEKIVSEFTLNTDAKYSSLLMPMLDMILKFSKITAKDINAAVVSIGPGSFTGLRIGISTAYGLAEALEIPVIGIPTLEVLAYNLFDVHGLICPILSARKGEVYAAVYRSDVNKSEKTSLNRKKIKDNSTMLKELFSSTAIKIENFIPILEQYSCAGENIFFVGEGADAFNEILYDSLGEKAIFVPSYLNYIRAGILAGIGGKRIEYKNKAFNNKNIITPLYCRKSELEYKRFKN